MSTPRIHSMGVFIWDPVWSLEDHVNQSADLILILKGSVRLHVEGQEYGGKSGDMLIVPPGKLHRDEFPLERLFEAFLVQFTWEPLERYLPAAINRKLLALPRARKQAIKRELLQMYETFRADAPLGRELNDARLLSVLLMMRSGVAEADQLAGAGEHPADGSRTDEVIRLVKEFVQDNLTRPISLRDIADHLGMSTYHLSHLFSRGSGFKLSEYLTHERMHEASRLLGDARVRISEAAYAVGYTDPNYFAKAFRRYFGVSPSRYREGHRKKVP